MGSDGTILALFPVTAWIVSRPRLDLRAATAAGLALYAIASWLQAGVMTTTASFESQVPTQILGGMGLALVFVPLQVALLRALDPAAIPPSLAIVRLAQQIGGSVATAGVVTFADRSFAHHQDALRDATVLSNPPIAEFLGHHAGSGLHALAQMVGQQAAVMSYADAIRLIAIVAAVSIPLPFLLRRERQAART